MSTSKQWCTNVLREEYKGLGYTPLDALNALWGDYARTTGFTEYRTEVGATNLEILEAVCELSQELLAELSN